MAESMRTKQPCHKATETAESMRTKQPCHKATETAKSMRTKQPCHKATETAESMRIKLQHRNWHSVLGLAQHSSEHNRNHHITPNNEHGCIDSILRVQFGLGQVAVWPVCSAVVKDCRIINIRLFIKGRKITHI